MLADTPDQAGRITLAPTLQMLLQFEKQRTSANELEAYLNRAAHEAKESEIRALAKADEGEHMHEKTEACPTQTLHLAKQALHPPSKYAVCRVHPCVADNWDPCQALAPPPRPL
jgi:hypothetical protein